MKITNWDKITSGPNKYIWYNFENEHGISLTKASRKIWKLIFVVPGRDHVTHYYMSKAEANNAAAEYMRRNEHGKRGW
jgi:hypothetical protein